MRTGIPVALARPGPARAAGHTQRLPSMPSTRPPASKRAYRCEHKCTLLHYKNLETVFNFWRCIGHFANTLEFLFVQLCLIINYKMKCLLVSYIMHLPYHCLNLQEEKGSDDEEEEEEDEKSATNSENLTINSSAPSSR